MTIIDHLEDLECVEKHATWIQAKCPVCGGKLKISINSYNYGSYACYTDYCHKDSMGVNHIRKLLFKPTPFKRSGLFRSPTVRRKLINYEIIRNREFKPTTLDQYKTFLPYQPLATLNNTVTYQYSPTFRVTRIAMPDGSKLFSYSYKKEDNWYKGYPEYPVVYADKYIQSHVFITEGEKCADALHKVGYAALALPAAFRKPGLIEKVIKLLVSRGVKSCIYLRDNDDTGLRDAKTFTHSAWKYEIDCKHVNPAVFFNSEDVSGFDIADVDSESIKQYLKSLFN